MPALYIKEQGSIIVKRDERIVVQKNNQKLLEIPMANIENIAIIGNVQITSQALVSLMDRGIEIDYFTFSGKHVGSSVSENSKNIFLRLAQYDYYQNFDRRIELAKKIVKNKVQNQIQIIKNYRWNCDYDWHSDIKRMQELINTIAERKNSNEILGVEGLCSNVYFGAYSHMFKCDVKFNGRNRRPPRDPINVILSLGYTFLTREISSALEAESFEMYLGYLHGIRYGRKSLALDIVEEFRQPFIDRMVLRTFNKRMFTKEDFDDEGDGIRLREEGFCKFCRIYEDWLKSEDYSLEEKSFQQIIREQSSKLKKSIRESKLYEPYIWKWEK